ncbi:MAG: shikimate dehydrogenase [Mycetocola sp.]
MWGSPIAHSLSPVLHSTAYRILGRTWSYGRREVTEAEFDSVLAERDQTWRGLSLTMPLKNRAYQAADQRDRVSTLTGASNTLVFTSAGVIAANSDVTGMVRALDDAGAGKVQSAAVIGGGATAASALCALAERGASEVTLYLRSVSRAHDLEPVAAALGMNLHVRSMPDLASGEEQLLISTIPGPAQDGLELPSGRFRGVPVLDVAYAPWPSRIATHVVADGSVAASGRDMLIHQAIAQIKLFSFGRSDQALPEEDVVLSAMRAAVA